MKLLLKRSLVPARIRTVKFHLYVRAQCDDAELDLLDRCNLMTDVLTLHEKEKGDGGTLDKLFALSENTELRVYDLIEGHTFSCERLDELLLIEEQLKKSSLALQKQLDLAASFGSEEVLDLKKLAEESHA